MAEIRTPDVDDLLCVLAAIDDPDTIFALLEDLFTVREIRETSQRLGVARLLAAGKSYAAIEEATGASVAMVIRRPDGVERYPQRCVFSQRRSVGKSWSLYCG